MKIHVELDLSTMFASEFCEISGGGYDAHVSEDSSILDAIKDSIRHEVTQAVLKEWRAQIGDKFNAEVLQAVNQLRQGFVEATLQSLLTEPAVKRSHYSDSMVSLRDYLKECIANEFDQRGVDRKVSELVNKLGDTMAKGLTARYDSAFAGRIVEKLHDHKMLRGDVATLLLGAPDPA